MRGRPFEDSGLGARAVLFILRAVLYIFFLYLSPHRWVYLKHVHAAAAAAVAAASFRSRCCCHNSRMQLRSIAEIFFFVFPPYFFFLPLGVTAAAACETTELQGEQ